MVNTLVLKPSGTGFEWCINQYNGCSIGCKYCYGMTMRKRKYEDWIKAKPRKDVVKNLQKDIKKLEENNKEVKDIFLGSICDSYQPLEKKHKLTRQIIEVLKLNDYPFTILTKNNLVLRDIDLLKSYELCRVGVTITSLDEKFRKDLEPHAVSYSKRIDVLKELKAEDIQTYLCCEPIIPVKESDPIAIVKNTKDFVDLFEFGMWNKYRRKGIPEHYYQNFSNDYYVKVFKEIIEFCESQKINYCLASHSRRFVEGHGLQFKPYPLLREG